MFKKAVVFKDDAKNVTKSKSDGIEMVYEYMYPDFIMAININVDNLLRIKYSVNQIIIKLCENDDVERIKFSVETITEFKQEILNNYNYLLDVCAKFNSIGICEYLMKYMANANNIETINDNGIDDNGNDDNVNPLHSACYHSNIKIVTLLLCNNNNNKIEINRRNLLQESALHIACFDNKNLDIVKLLINASIDVNLIDKYGDTAFSNACLKDAHDIVEYLLSINLMINLNVDKNNQHIREYQMERPDLFQNILN